MGKRDPLRNPGPLIRRVYSYVAYRIGDGPDAEDVTSDVFERAIRYRSGYDPARGDSAVWLLGIARRAVADHLTGRTMLADGDVPDLAAPSNLEVESVNRMSIAQALGKLSGRDRELLSLRYGADLKARQIAEILEMETHAVEVAITRALARMREFVGER
jgi:RNA polymerase sigma-70 factor (ECF subfamily)